MDRWRTLFTSKIILRHVMFTNNSCSYSLGNGNSPNPTETLVFSSEKKKNSVFSLLSNYGFSEGQIKHLIYTSHSILSSNERDLSKTLLHWHSYFAKDKLFKVLTTNPELLSLSPLYITSRVKELMGVFTKSDISKLLFTCPRVFTDDLEVIMKKVEYIVHNMSVPQGSIVKAEALQFELNYIKCRHSFMCRAGRYFSRKKQQKSRNPPLGKILSKNLGTFLKLCQLSEEEFFVFREMFEEQLLSDTFEDLDEEENEKEE